MEPTEILEKIHNKPIMRSMEADRSTIVEDDMTVEFSASSEYKVRQWFGYEILDHKNTSIRWGRLKDGAAIRDGHYGEQIGVIEKAWLDTQSRKIKVRARYSKNNERAKQIFADIKDAILRNVSMGYDIHKMQLEEENRDERISTYRITDWEPLHVAHVPDAADPSIGIGRSNELNTSKEKIQDMIETALREHENKIKLITNKNGDNKMDPNTNTSPAVDPKPQINVEEERREQEQKRIADIDTFAREWKDKVKGVNLEDVANDYKKLGRSADKFADFVADQVSKGYREAAAKPVIQLTQKEIEGYSLSRAIAAIVNGDGSPELDISAQYSKDTGRVGEGKRGMSFFMPHSVLDYRFMKEKRMQRDVNTTAATGGEFIATDHLGGEWIDALRAEMILDRLGMRMLPGRKGDISIPKLTTGNAFGWAATENAQSGESSPATTAITMSPKRGGFYVDISKTAIVQSDPALDSVLNQDGRQVMALGFQAGVFEGTGANGQFKGIKNLTSVNNDTMASVDWVKILNLIKSIKADKAALGPMSWVTNATGEAILRGREKGSAGYPVYLLGDDDRIAGRSAFFTESITSPNIFLGCFNQAYYAFWDALDVVVDIYTLATYHQIRLVFNQLADFAVRHDEAFAYASDLS